MPAPHLAFPTRKTTLPTRSYGLLRMNARCAYAPFVTRQHLAGGCRCSHITAVRAERRRAAPSDTVAAPRRQAVVPLRRVDICVTLRFVTGDLRTTTAGRRAASRHRRTDRTLGKTPFSSGHCLDMTGRRTINRRFSRLPDVTPPRGRRRRAAAKRFSARWDIQSTNACSTIPLAFRSAGRLSPTYSLSVMPNLASLLHSAYRRSTAAPER